MPATTRCRSLLIATLALAAPNAFATPPALVWCSGCSAANKANAALTQPAGVVYVGDTLARSVAAYSVYVDTVDTVPPKHVKTADPIAPAAPQKDYVLAMIDYYNTAPVGWAKHESLPYHTGNVYDVINVGPAQNDMTDYFYDHSFVGTLAPRIVGIAASMHLVDQTAVPKTEFEVTFDDGSRIDIAVDLTATNPKFRVDATTGRDSHNNTVLATPQTGGGVATFGFGAGGNPNDFMDWQQQMTLLGYTIDMTGSGSHGFACTTVEGANPVRHCQRY